jgi:hypothetical protein
MILPFSTQINGKPTYFVDKIWSGLIAQKLATIETCRRYEYNREKVTPKEFAIVPHYFPKLHTIREDKNDRWKVGTKIDFFINCRQKNMFRFAPVLPVVSTQKVHIMWVNTFGTFVARVFIDDQSFACVNFEKKEMIVTGKMLELAQNDGFDTIEDFFAYFNKDFTGKIIHWTDLRY